MIDEKTKEKLLKELEKSGNVYLSCIKTGVNKATYYRWKNENKEFRKLADKAIRFGRENNCEVAEHVLMLKIKDKDSRSIEYYLNHNSDRYRTKRDSSVVIFHKKEIAPLIKHKTLEDLLWESQERLNKEEENLEPKIEEKKEELPPEIPIVEEIKEAPPPPPQIRKGPRPRPREDYL